MISLGQSYQEVEPKRGGFERPPAGGYVFRCLKTDDKSANSGAPMLTLSMDIAEGSFARSFEQFPIRYFQLLGSKENMGYLKAIIEDFQASNEGLRLVDHGGNFDERLLVGKLIGGCLREDEYMAKDGTLKTKMGIAYFCTVKKVRDGQVKALPLKVLEGKRPAPVSGSKPPEDDLPF